MISRIGIEEEDEEEEEEEGDEGKEFIILFLCALGQCAMNNANPQSMEHIFIYLETRHY